jgi:hypothetical protein
VAFWLKMIGTSEKPWDKCYDRKHIGFRGRKPSGIHPGDQMVPYAVGHRCIFAVAEVASDWNENEEVGWPYRVEIRWPLAVNVAPSKGVDAADVSAGLSQRI